MNFRTLAEKYVRTIYKSQFPWSARFRRASTNAPTTTTDPHAYCKDLVRKYDYDSFLTSYFYPQEAQSGFFAIKAFSVSSPSSMASGCHFYIWTVQQAELAMIQDNVSNTMIGRMRMQFWRDAVKGISDVRL